MSPLFLVLFFLLGLAAGSFGNVLIARRRELESIFATRSRCPACRTTLSALELIPLLSYLYLHGRCRSCGKRISFQYPVVELIAGFLFLWLASRLTSLSPLSLFIFLLLLVITVLALVLATTDLIEHQYPTSLLYLMVGLALIYGLAASFESGVVGGSPFLALNVRGLFVGGLIGLGVMGGLYLISRRRGVGEGDIYLGLMSGFLTGYPGVLISLGLAFMAGGLFALVLLLLRERKIGDELPFGPFILAATLLVVVYGERMLRWLFVT